MIGPGDRVLRIEGGEAPDQVLELAHVARPAIALQPVHRLAVELLARQALLLDER